MDAKFSTYLSGFNGFGRSFNRSVLAHDLHMHQEYKAALNNGSLPCNRLRILTVGDKGVGKSSTLQHLQGQVCDPDAEPQATEGIEITVCETSDREPSWKPCRNGVRDSADDPSLCAAWCVCAGVDSLGGVLHSGKEKAASEDVNDIILQLHPRHNVNQRMRKATTSSLQNLSITRVSQTLRRFILRLLYQGQLAFPAVVLFCLFSYLANDFGVLCWLAVFSSVPLFKWDFNSSYRFITPVMLQLISVEAAIAVKQYLASLGETWQPVVGLALVLYLGVCAVSSLFGLLCGLGCRSGVAIAFCLMTHRSLIHLHPKALAVLVTGNLLGLLLMRDGFKRIQKIVQSQKHLSIILSALVVCVAVMNYKPLISYLECLCVLDLLVGILMGFGFPYGVLKGREIVASRKLMLPYILKKSFGFVVAIATGHLITWKLLIFSETSTPVSIICSILAACGFPVYDWIVAKRVKALEKDNIPITTFRQFLMDAATQDNPVSLKLQFWDNAGDSVYQTMQQFFRPAEAVYLLVFNLEEAREDGDLQIQRLCQWLFTVKAHSKNPNTLVFIVGTHRDSVTEEFIASFAADIDDKIYRDFCSILAINGDKGPLYVVENSKPMDVDGLNLRQSVINVAKKTPFMKELFPIRHLNLLNKIQDRLAEYSLPWIITISDLLSEIAEDDMSLEELQKILVSLNRTGDVIYRDDDSILKEYVVIRPQNLLDVLKAIVRIPPKASRRLREADDWVKMEEQGIASLKLIKAVVQSETLLPFVIRLMESYNLLIPINSTQVTAHQLSQDKDEDLLVPIQPASVQSGLGLRESPQQLPNYFVIPSHLPEHAGDDTSFWEPSEEDEEYFFDFGYVTADMMFHRLLATCWNDRDVPEQVFKARGRFRHQGANFYTIQLQKVSISQNTIRVIILHSSNNRCALQVLQFLHHLVEDIRRRDFPNLPYACGPVCRTCSSESFLRVLKVCGHDKKFPRDDKPFEAFMLQGKYHEVHLTPQLKVTCGRRKRTTSSNSSGCSPMNYGTSEDPLPLHQISVGETSQNVSLVIAGNHSKIDVHPHRANSLPNEDNVNST